jgi:hypothetical protein
MLGIIIILKCIFQVKNLDLFDMISKQMDELMNCRTQILSGTLSLVGWSS